MIRQKPNIKASEKQKTLNRSLSRGLPVKARKEKGGTKSSYIIFGKTLIFL